MAVRRDAAGRQLCEICGRQLAKVKHHRPSGAGRACTPRCKPQKGGNLLASAPTLPPPRSHKKGASNPGKERPAPAVLIAPPPLPPTPPPFFHSHGTSFRPSTRTSRATSTSWLELALDSELNRWEEKRGGYFQHDTALSLQCSSQDEKRVRLRHSAERIARAELSSLGVNATSLRLAAIKLLRSSKGEGEQEIHYDIPEYDRAVQCFTVLIYLTDTISTAVPTQSMKELRHCFTDGEKKPSAAALRFLSRDKFRTERVPPGAMLALNCAVPHFGMRILMNTIDMSSSYSSFLPPFQCRIRKSSDIHME